MRTCVYVVTTNTGSELRGGGGGGGGGGGANYHFGRQTKHLND